MTQIIIQERNPNELTDNIIMFCDKDKNLLSQAQLIDSKLDDKVSTYLQFAEFEAKTNAITHMTIVSENSLKNVYIVCLGDTEKLTAYDLHMGGIKAVNYLSKTKTQIASLIIEDILPLDHSAEFIKAMMYHSYEFNEWKSDAKATKLMELSVQIESKLVKVLEEQISEFKSINDATNLARDLVNRPGNVVTPDYLANEAKELKSLGVKIEILDQKKIEKLGLNLLLAVGKGSENEPMLVTMKYMGAGKGAPVNAIVGKGITFDTGGYSLKAPSTNMREMKSDMAGAATVLGTIKALATLKAPINVIGVMACAENMVSSNAYKVDDVIKSYNGLSVEIGNTDAEGRLVLADALSYTVKNNEITEIIDIATLTMSTVITFATEYAGIMGYNQNLIDNLQIASQKSHEPIWQLPMNKAYANYLKSNIADIKNLGGRYGGTITAGEFLSKFVEDTPWAHIDIASTAYIEQFPGSYANNGIKGATGFGVRLLTQYYLNKTKEVK
jgi:leucyl aminopeptidase